MDNDLKKNLPVVAIVVPCYNEQEIITHSSGLLHLYVQKLIENNAVNKDSFICFINDGSKDSTLSILQKIKKEIPIRIINLTRNYGHQAALLAGLHYVEDKCDCAVSIDADLQDDIEVIGDMIEKYKGGNEIVYGVRKARSTDSFFKRFTAKRFYRLMLFAGVRIVYNHADFRLMSSRALNFLKSFNEVNLFLRGIIPEIGLKSDFVYYDRKKRIAGNTKYPLKKMTAFAMEGISSFSVMPLRMMTALGFVIILISLIVGVYVLIGYLAGNVIQGWASTFISIWFLGGIQLFALGVLGEYIGKIYKESKRRPVYLIDEIFE